MSRDPSMDMQASNHMMKNTKKGRPFIQDLHDLFSTLIVSLNLGTHRQFFKQYHNAFTTDGACQNLSSLKFTQSSRSADPKDPNRILTTTTTTTFTMTRELAKGMCQHFMDAHLIENAADPSSSTFKDRGIYVCTPKGLHILERFVAKNGIAQQQRLKVFASQPICMKLLHLERKPSDDELCTSKVVVEMLWRRFAGRKPNRIDPSQLPSSYSPSSSPSSSASTPISNVRHTRQNPPSGQSTDIFDQTHGAAFRKHQEKDKTGKLEVVPYAIGSFQVIGWLLDHTTMAHKEEAMEMAARFVWLGFLELISERGKVNKDMATKTVVQGKEDGPVKSSGEFRASEKAIYKVTERGMQAARWPGYGRDSVSHPLVTGSRSVDTEELTREERPSVNRVLFGRSITDQTPFRHSPSPHQVDQSELLSHTDSAEIEPRSSPEGGGSSMFKESHTTKLQQILEEPSLRSLFREFLRSCFCEENLSYWLDVQELRKRFSTTSSAAAAGHAQGQGQGKSKDAANSTMERHQQDLVAVALNIYNTYLAPHSPSELNIDHNLRGDLVNYVSRNLLDQAAIASSNLPSTNATGMRALSSSPDSKPNATANSKRENDSIDPRAYQMDASNLQSLLTVYEQIQSYIFRLMATDSVPKFSKSDLFLSRGKPPVERKVDYAIGKPILLGSAYSVNESADEEDIQARAYLTISQAAREKYTSSKRAAAAAAALSSSPSTAPSLPSTV
ncbi:Winged helix-turn-helix DNA-binding domain [Phaffia rhodozyma]|uniref:Winged helix-turn-helix DNA-binding domain n=1 Tax=Phaffia rhodozyma TaxID=264483 RepID=A0A0F7SYZ0_PHARH|nr:Winged helix-turn-helix DNA-binding domain [Phaffia rhodozyma]